VFKLVLEIHIYQHVYGKYTFQSDCVKGSRAELGVLAHICNLSTWEAETRRILSLRPAWNTQQDLSPKNKDERADGASIEPLMVDISNRSKKNCK
jgi:hypothetical protein